MSKKMKFLIILGIVLCVIGLFFGISTIYRFWKLQTVLSEVNNNIEKNNYVINTVITENGVSIKTQTYFKDGVGKFVRNDGRYTWFDGKNAYLIDEENKTVNILNLEETNELVFKDTFASLYPNYTKNIFQKLMYAGNLSNSIKTETYNGEKCTVYEIEDEGVIKTYWITKKWSNLVKAQIEFIGGKKIEYQYDIKFHITKLKDIELPDISTYTITNENGEKVETTVLNNNQQVEPQNVIVQNVIQETTSQPIG